MTTTRLLGRVVTIFEQGTSSDLKIEQSSTLGYSQGPGNTITMVCQKIKKFIPAIRDLLFAICYFSYSNNLFFCILRMRNFALYCIDSTSQLRKAQNSSQIYVFSSGAPQFWNFHSAQQQQNTFCILKGSSTVHTKMVKREIRIEVGENGSNLI